MTDEEQESAEASDEAGERKRGPFSLDVTVHLDVAALVAVILMPPIVAGLVLALLSR